MAKIETLIFLVIIILVALLISLRALRRSRTSSGYFVADGGFTPGQNGMAIAGDFLSAAAFLGITGATALHGLSGFYLAISVPTTFVLVTMIIAEPLRALGRYTLSDVLAARFEDRKLRALAAINALTISSLFMIAQFVGAGLVLHLLLHLSYPVSLISIGVLMTIYVSTGGMLAVTWIQIFKTSLLLIAGVVLFLLTLSHFNWNPANILSAALTRMGPAAILPPHPNSLIKSLDYISLNFAVALGTIGLPHVIVRFLTVRNTHAARASALTASWIIALFLLSIAVTGLGAAALLGTDAIHKANQAGTLATPMLADFVGGSLLFAFVSAVVFATSIAVIAGVAISASATFVLDLYANILRRHAGEHERMVAGRLATIGVCVVALLISLGAAHLNLALIGVLAFTVAASGNVPVLLLTLFWRNFNGMGALCGMAGGFIASVGLVLIGPIVCGHAALFPLANVGLASIPIGFLSAFAGTWLSRRDPEAQARFDAIMAKISLTS